MRLRLYLWLSAFICGYLIYPIYAKDESDISELKRIVKDTSYGNYWDRLDAIKKLGKIGTKESIGLLIELLGDKEPPIREASVMSLSRLRDKDLIKWFCEQTFSHTNAEIRANAVWALRFIKDETTLPYLFKALQDNNPSVVSRALKIIALFPSAVTQYELISQKLNAPQSEVRIAAAQVFGSIIDARNYETLIRKLKDPSPAVRATVVESLSKTARKQCQKDLINILKDSDYQVRQAALAALLAVDESEALKSATQYIRDRDWRVRATAISILRQIRQRECLEPLIQQLTQEKGRLRYDIVSALKDLTGKSLGYNALAWQKWYETNKDNIKIAGPGSSEQDLDAGETVACFYEVPVFGENIIFIIDFSGSMKTEDKEGKKKIDIAREELSKALAKFGANIRFDIILMSTEAKRIKKRQTFGKLTPATEPNRSKALDFVASIWDSLEDIKRGRGDMYDALMEAFDQPEVDTIFLLSDGKPTYGQYIVEENILENLEKENQYRKIVVNTILTGEKGISVKLMESIARLTGGIFKRK